MVWSTRKRVFHARPGDALVLVAELRNKSDEDVHAVGLRAIASQMLDARCSPTEIVLAPRSRATVDIELHPKRVGRWGVHGLALEVRTGFAGGDSAYEAPLMFANPIGVEVRPRALVARALSPRGGRARISAPSSQSAALPGEGDEFRELRDHSPGDAFRRIAWRASARMGKLVVREMERSERDVVWAIVDASADHWGGRIGYAPLDTLIETAGALIVRHLDRGDSVGLAIVAGRPRAFIEPSRRRGHASRLTRALVSAANLVDADRTSLDEREVAALVLEHARPLDPAGLSDIASRDIDMLAARASMLEQRAPFSPRVPFAPSSRERTLRRYLAAFGIEVPPSLDGEAAACAQTTASILAKIASHKPRPTLVYFFGPTSLATGEVVPLLRRLHRRGVGVRFISSYEDLAASPPPSRSVEEAITEAVVLRREAAHARGARALARLGITTRQLRADHAQPE